MTITPDKSALAKARERLEAECLSWSSAAAAMRSHGSPHAGSADDCERNASDLRLVLDALAEAERARHVYPSLSCNKCGQPASITIGGLCSPCHIAEDFQS